MVNPFGDESDSIFAWKERYKQQEFQIQTLQQRITELKEQYDQLNATYQHQKKTVEMMDEANSKQKQEFLELKNIAQERLDRISHLEQNYESSVVDQLKVENARIQTELERLQGEVTRGGGPDISANLSTLLTPIILHEFDQNNKRYQNSFANLVEAVITDGDAFQKVIGLLVKQGGTGTISNIQRQLDSPETSVAIEMLIEENILKHVEDRVSIVTSEDAVAPQQQWNELSLPEVFDLLKNIVANEPDDHVIVSLDSFRDTLQDREIPLAKIFFEIRKMAEGISKGTIARKDAVQQVDDWWNRAQSVV
ncbi:MAG: hypothetical protein ACXAB7_09515 [Candidatus Kariarchaeaceae archaeon]|jgi:hypothetical protein